MWGGLSNEHRYHLVNWQQICTPIQVGGLGIRNVAVFNKALLGKWLWRYATEPIALWRWVVDSKYGSQWRGWCSNHSREPYGVSLWNHIRRGWTWFSQYIGFKVGDGSRIKFWSGSWSRDQLLWDRFSTLFRLARNQEALVVDYLHFHGTLPMRPGRTDSILWNLSRHASFEVSSFYSALSHQLLLSFHGG